jgi:hypothetical protein
MTWNIFPSGADIGLHESTIASILFENTNLFWNYYHMGGGFSATNPGYHTFVISVMAFTGITGYLAQVLVTSFFSAITALCAFLIVRRVWSESAAFIVSFLVVFSGGDIAILCWGGYPNIIALMLIPVIFYVFFQRKNFSTCKYLILSSLLIGALFFTHLFSALVFTAITVFVFLGSVLLKRGYLTFYSISFLLPIGIGTLLAVPYLVGVAPMYFSSQGAITGAVSAIKQALLETRTVSTDLILISLLPVLLCFFA